MSKGLTAYGRESFFRVTTTGGGILVTSLDIRWFLFGRCIVTFQLTSKLNPTRLPMASLQQISSGTYYILFRFGGHKYKRSLKTKERRRALSLKARLEGSIEMS